MHTIPKGSEPFEVVHIDHYGPINSQHTSKKHILVVIDAYTKLVKQYPTKTTSSKEVIVALKEYLRYYSRPRCIISDRGSSFTSNEFEQYLSDNNIRHIKIATASPQANGQVECVNRCLGPMISKLVDEEKKIYWDKTLDTVEFAINNTVQRTIGEHPSVMLFGTNQRGQVLDSLRENIIDNEQVQGDINREKIRDEAEAKQSRSQSYNKQYVDSHRLPSKQYKLGAYVMVKNFDSRTGISSKLIPKYRGPYKITKILENDRYLIEDVEGMQQTQIPYKGIWAVANIKPWLNEEHNREK